MAQRAASSADAEPAAFPDPERRVKLASAFPEIDRLFSAFATRTHVPGAVWGVVVDGQLAHLGSFGTRDLASEAPVDGETVFRIASMTKSFTAMAVLKLRDEGKLRLDDPVETYVPELRGLAYPTSDSPKISIRHLLSHSVGFPEDNPWGDQQLARSEAELSAMLARGIPFSTSPGTAYEYSNLGFAILGRVIANVSHRPYREYLRAEILEPLGMTSTTLEASQVTADRLAHGYRWEDEGWKEEAQLADGSFGAMGGLLTSMRDLSRYVGVLMSAWPPRDGDETAPIRRASLREMQQVSRSIPAALTRAEDGSVALRAGGYGYGLRVSQSCDFRHIVAHSGGLPGFGSLMQWLPEHGVGLIALGNLTYTGWGGVANDALTALRRTGALQPRVVPPSPALRDAQRAVSRLIVRWDDGTADRVAAGNLFLDKAKERRRREIDELRREVGACEASEAMDAENALRGQWTMTCERGSLDVAITLAPTLPPTVQFLSVERKSAAKPASACVQ